MEMIQFENNDLSQKIFMFENKNGNLVQENKKSNKIQEALRKCSLFNGMDIENIPNFRFFQIKKHMVTTEDGIKRYTIQFIDISAKVFYDDLKA